MGDCCAHPSSTLLSGGTTPRHVRASGGTSPLGIPAFEGTPSQSCVRELAHLIGNTRQVRESTNSLDERAAVFDANDLASLLAMGSERNRLRSVTHALEKRGMVLELKTFTYCPLTSLHVPAHTLAQDGATTVADTFARVLRTALTSRH